MVNAITHRDYSNTGEYILIKIFNDRLEISSPGSLGGFVTIDNMKTDMPKIIALQPNYLFLTYVK